MVQENDPHSAPVEHPPYRPRQVAARWGVSPYAVMSMIRAGKLAAFRVNHLYLIPQSAVDRVERGESVG